MNWHHFDLEPQLFHTHSFMVRAESKEKALSKLKAHFECEVKRIENIFEGEADQKIQVWSAKEYWETGMRNRVYLGERMTPIQKAAAYIV